jgi:hypothetical protein
MKLNLRVQPRKRLPTDSAPLAQPPAQCLLVDGFMVIVMHCSTASLSHAQCHHNFNRGPGYRD